MQTLNEGAGQSDAEYKAAAEQRQADLLNDCRTTANLFFWAAGLAALGSGLLPSRIGLLVNVGFIDLLTLYGGFLGPLFGLTMLITGSLWIAALIGLGFAGRSGRRWAKKDKKVFFGLDCIALMATL